MSWNSWSKLGKPTSTPPVTRAGKAGQKPPSWMADKWNQFKAVGGTAMTLGTGAALGSMIPFAAGKATERDINRMRNYETVDGR